MVTHKDTYEHQESYSRHVADVRPKKRELTEDYKVIPQATGHGVAGLVYPAINRRTKEVRAVKTMKKETIKVRICTSCNSISHSGLSDSNETLLLLLFL